MSRFLPLARTPRTHEAAWVEADQTLRAAANEGPLCEPAAPPCDAKPPADGARRALPARTALWFWAESSAHE
jgi:hypothetical protein